MAILSPVRELGRGLNTYWRGVQWLRSHPRYLVLLFVPIVVGLCFIAGGISVFSAYDQTVMSWVLFAKPATWYGLMAFYLCEVLAYAAVIVLMLVTSLLLMNVVASPLYDIVSTAIEKDLTGLDPPQLTLRQHLQVIVVELKKVLAIVFVTTLLLFIPGLNIVSSLVAAFLVGWDFFDYPLARRGFSLRQRVNVVGGEFFAVLGLGLWLVIPIAQIILLPMAVAGGTILSLETLDAKQRQGTPVLKEIH